MTAPRNLAWTTANKSVMDRIDEPPNVFLLEVDSTPVFIDDAINGATEYTRRATIKHEGSSGDPDLYFRPVDSATNPTPPAITTTATSSPQNGKTNGIRLAAGQPVSFSYSSRQRLVAVAASAIEITVILDDKAVSFSG